MGGGPGARQRGVTDSVNDRIQCIDADGTLTTLAGSGVQGFGGDGGGATNAEFNVPRGIAIDDAGRVVVADAFNNRIRSIELDGTITTLAGTGVEGFSGEGGPATSAALGRPGGVAFDAAGRILIADTLNHRIRRIETDGTIVTIVGTGAAGFLGDGGPAVRARLAFPEGVAVDATGRVLVADTLNHRIRRVDVDGTITTLAGTGAAGFFGDGGPATSAALRTPRSIAVDSLDRVLIADSDNHRIRRIDLDGTITTAAGTGTAGFAGDGGPAASAAFDTPRGVVVDGSDRILVVDTNNSRVRRIDVDGTITSIAGGLHPNGPGPFERARLCAPAALASFAPGVIVSVGDFGRALRVDLAARVVEVVVGYEAASPSVFGEARFAPLLGDARGVVLDPIAVALVITEATTGDLRVIGLDPDGDGVIDDPAAWTSAGVATGLSGPAGIAYDVGSDTFVVADQAAHCVQRVDRDGVVVGRVFGRCGSPGSFPGFLTDPTHVVVSPSSGAVYVADTGNHRVLRVDDSGTASVVIGDGSVSSAGEGSPARLFPVNAPRQMALDAFGNLYVTSTTTLRLVENVDGDLDADGDDRVATIFGGGARDTFPESDTFCLHTVAVADDGNVYAADACQGYLVRVEPTVD